ncbi:MAG: LysM peptidoglycan-binding domain-containing protein [Verrucomicrobia bacterium]|nr:LysM peptidoglycan-binding domain-containing protein [Verrucomicrobiota bacterium]
MKKIFALAAVGLLAGNCALRAQDASAVADRQAAEERYQKLAGKVEDLTATLDAQNKRLADLQEQIKALRDEQAKPNADVAGRDELKALAVKMKEIDEKRAADKELILKEIGRLAQVPAVAPVKGKPKVTPKTTDSEPAADPNAKYEGYEHVVKSGDTLSKVVAAYREKGVKVTMSQVLKHPLNSKVDADKLLIGQKIFIPDVK